MKVRYILFLVLCLGIGLFLWKKEEKHPDAKTQFPVTEQKPFVLIIPSYNNARYVEKNLRSVFSQQYDNYRVIYIDDYSNDETLEKVGLLLTELDKKKRTSLIYNSQNQGGLANVYNAIHACFDHEIIVLLDGDDFLAHDHVLSTLNEIYADPDVWLTFGNHLEYPTYSPSKASTQVDRAHFVAPPLRTFYAALFKHIDTKDLIYRGKFYPMSWDLAIMLPLVEMAKNHHRFIEQTLYLSNRSNPLLDQKINPQFHTECEHHIRSKLPYRPLKKLESQASTFGEKVDLVVFSYDNPMQLYALLESVEQQVLGLNKISVLYRASSIHLDTAYLALKLQFPNVHFLRQDFPSHDFKKLLNTLVFEKSLPSSRYILFAPDTLVVREHIDLSKGIASLEKTGAYALYYSLHKNLQFCSSLQRFQPIPIHTPLPGIFAEDTPQVWEFFEGVDDFNTPSNFLFALYRKEDLELPFQKLDYDSPKSLLLEWGQLPPPRPLGLFFPTGKVIKIVSKRNKDFLEKFNSGHKIDLFSLDPTVFPSQKIESELIFTSK